MRSVKAPVADLLRTPPCLSSWVVFSVLVSPWIFSHPILTIQTNTRATHVQSIVESDVNIYTPLFPLENRENPGWLEQCRATFPKKFAGSTGTSGGFGDFQEREPG
jgi:hypothetical protein